MTRSTARWTTAIATAAVLALPVAGLAQSRQPQPPATQTTPDQQVQSPQEHLANAKQALDEIQVSTVPPEAREQLTQIEQHLATLEQQAQAATPADDSWKKTVAEIDRIIVRLTSEEGSSATGDPVGTTGSAGAALDPTVRGKLSDVRESMSGFAAAMAQRGGSPAAQAGHAGHTGANPYGTGTTQPPATGSAQPQTPPTTTTPTTGQTMTQPPAGTEPQAEPETEARQHLTAARNALSDLTQLPAAAQLTGDARTQVSELISNFNELITTDQNWRESHAKVEANLTALIGAQTTDESSAPTAGTSGAVGTAGGLAGNLDPEIQSKLVEFRSHLEKFEAAAEAAESAPGAAATDPSAATGAPATGAPTTGAPTSGAPTSGEPGGTAPSGGIDRQEILRHIQAIEGILASQEAAATAGASGTTATGEAAAAAGSGITLTPTQIQQLREHLNELKRLAGGQ